MNPLDILAEYYNRGSKTFEILVAHGNQAKETSVKQILRGLKRYGTDKVQRFQSWAEMFER